MNEKKFKLFLLLLLVILFFTQLFLFFHPSPKQKECFENFTKENDIDKIINNVKVSIETKEDKRTWDTFYIKSSGKGQYSLYDSDLKNAIISVQVTNNQNLKHYYFYQNNKLMNFSFQETRKGNSSVWGTFQKKPIEIKLYHGKERIIINFDNDRFIIQGIGDFQGVLPYPWFYGFPMVFMEGGQVVCMWDYFGNKQEINENIKQIPVEIIISEEHLQYLPIYLQVYAMIYEHLNKKILF
jgi:hypothetical protein